MSRILVTGAAGFIGSHIATALLDRGDQVVAVDNLNDYYDVGLKQARLARLRDRAGFRFHTLDIADAAGWAKVLAAQPIDGTIHLAAQAGVRHSIDNPLAYIHSNITGTVTLLEALRAHAIKGPFVYASSSSVYGANTKVPFAVEDRTDAQLSLYGATKKSCELIAHSYAHLHRVPATGLRFFTVYGPWGRPDMAPHLFTRAVLTGQPVRLFGEGRLSRDFTYIDDITAGVLAAYDHPPPDDGVAVPHRVYNLGNTRAEAVRDFLGAIEQAAGRAAIVELAPMQPGDVPQTWADVESSRRDLGYAPTTPITTGVPRFVAWFRAYYGL